MTDLTRVSTAMIAALPLIGGSGGATQSLESILLERVSVKRFGAKGDGTTDDTAAIQAAITWALVHNCCIYLPAGIYRTTATLTIDMQSNIYDALARFWMVGDGQGSSLIHPDISVTGPVINILGGAASAATSAGHQVWSGIEKIGIEGAGVVGSRAGVGIAGENLAYFRLDAVRIVGMVYGCYFRDILTCIFQSLNIRYCNRGFFADRNATASTTDYESDPNALLFQNCTFGLLSEYGVELIQGAGDHFDTCTFEGIGSPDFGGDGTSGFGVRLISMGREGIVGAVFTACYTENNDVAYDVIIDQGENHAAYHFNGCTFARVSAEHYSISNIRVTQNESSRAVLNIDGCGFKGLSTYVEDAGRPYLSIQNHPLIEVHLGHGNLWGSSIAAPYGRTPRVFRAAMTAGQSVPNATATKVAFASGEVNDNLWFDTSAQVFHAYARCRMHFTAQLWFADVPDGGDCSVKLVRNNAAGGTTTVASNGIFSRGAGTCVTVSTIENMEEGDTMEVQGYQNSGGTRNIYGSPSLSYFMGHPV